MNPVYVLYKKLERFSFIATISFFLNDVVLAKCSRNRSYTLKKIKKVRKRADNKKEKSKTLQDLKIAYICDEITYQNFSYLTTSFFLTPKNWYEVMEKEKPDFLFCESAWSGIKDYRDCWRGRIYRNHHVKYEHRKVLLNILEYCHQERIKTVFWNKEDPSYFGNQSYDFVDTALRFDYIFTTCQECVDQYKAYGHARVAVLPFGFSPRLYNPIGTTSKENKAIFAGSWYPAFQERCMEMEEMFRMVQSYGIQLCIYDRNAQNKSTTNVFPEQYQPYICGSVPYTGMGEVVKNCQYAININSVKNSESMFARRVYEMMASNMCVISNESVGMKKQFQERVWFLGEKAPGDRMNNMNRKNVQDVFAYHTNRKRLEELIEFIGISIAHKKISVVIVSDDRRQSISCEDIRIDYCPDISEIDIRKDYFIVEKNHEFQVEEIRMMIPHYEYLSRDISIGFFTPCYEISTRKEMWDLLIPMENIEQVKRELPILVYGI